MKIDAIEIFERNITPVYGYIYDNVYHGDAAEVLPELGRYDVIICSHMIEHLDKKTGLSFLEEMRKHADVAVIVCLPLGDWPQGEIDGNPHEEHKSTWTPLDLKPFGGYLKRFGKREGVFIMPCNDEAKWQVGMLRNPVKRLLYPVWAKRRKEGTTD